MADANPIPDMIERIEQALLKALGEQTGCGWCRCTCFGAADVLECKLHVTAYDLAKAAISAMREPTAAMIEVGFYSDEAATKEEVAHIYTHMIDAALGE